MADTTKRSLLIVTVNSVVDQVITNIRNHNYDGFKIAGVVILDQDRTGEMLDGEIPIVWQAKIRLQNMPAGSGLMKSSSIFRMDSSVEKEIDGSVYGDGNCCASAPYKVEDFSDRMQFVERFGIYTVLTTSINCATPMQAFLKRAMDIAGGLAGCLITGILYIFLAPAIKSQSPGPVFFSQVRIGKNGKKFKMYKFRSMYGCGREKERADGTEPSQRWLYVQTWTGIRVSSEQASSGWNRQEGVGNYIRDWSLDEFPQVFNVLKGDMSLVGTRPPTVDEWDKYDLHHRARMAMRPGVTGMWQVSGRSNITDFEDVVKLDTKYIREWSMGLDLRILLKTVLVVFKKEGSM